MAEPAMPKPKPPPTIIIDLGEPSHVKQDIAKPVSAAMEPKINKSVLISTMESGTSKVDFEPLSNILQRFRDTTQLLENWISVTKPSPNSTQHSHPLNTDVEKFNQSTSGLQLQVPTLQLHYASATTQSILTAAPPQTASTEFRSPTEILHNQDQRNQNPTILMGLHDQHPPTTERNHHMAEHNNYLHQETPNMNVAETHSAKPIQPHNNITDSYQERPTPHTAACKHPIITTKSQLYTTNAQDRRNDATNNQGLRTQVEAVPN
jgi:hypothetical protein